MFLLLGERLGWPGAIKVFFEPYFRWNDVHVSSWTWELLTPGKWNLIVDDFFVCPDLQVISKSIVTHWYKSTSYHFWLSVQLLSMWVVCCYRNGSPPKKNWDFGPTHRERSKSKLRPFHILISVHVSNPFLRRNPCYIMGAKEKSDFDTLWTWQRRSSLSESTYY